MSVNVYEGALQRYPLLTKSVTSACFATASSVIASIYENNVNRRKRLSLQRDGTNNDDDEARKRVANQRKRMLQMFAFGLFFSGPSNHFWHVLLENYIFKKSKTNSILNVLKRGELFSPFACILLESHYNLS